MEHVGDTCGVRYVYPVRFKLPRYPFTGYQKTYTGHPHLVLDPIPEAKPRHFSHRTLELMGHVYTVLHGKRGGAKEGSRDTGLLGKRGGAKKGSHEHTRPTWEEGGGGGGGPKRGHITAV